MPTKKRTIVSAKSGIGNQPRIGDPLRDAVAASGMSWYQLAQETGLHLPALYKWRDGKDLSLASAEVLAEYFGLSLRLVSRKRIAARKDN